MKTLSALLLIASVTFVADAATVGRTNKLFSVTLAWDISTDLEVQGYNVYYGPASGNYTNVVQVKNFFPFGQTVYTNLAQARQYSVTNAVVDKLPPGSTNFFAATAFDKDGLESDYSNEVSWNAPTKPTPPGKPNIVSTNSAIVLYGIGNPNTEYAVKSSTDLREWLTVATGTTTSDGEYRYEEIPFQTANFFRVEN